MAVLLLPSDMFPNIPSLSRIASAIDYSSYFELDKCSQTIVVAYTTQTSIHFIRTQKRQSADIFRVAAYKFRRRLNLCSDHLCRKKLVIVMTDREEHCVQPVMLRHRGRWFQ